MGPLSQLTYHHLINGIYDVIHFLLGDIAIVVNIIKSKCPWEEKQEIYSSFIAWTITIFLLSFSQLSFSSRFPLEVIDKARINSSNSIEPS